MVSRDDNVHITVTVTIMKLKDISKRILNQAQFNYDATIRFVLNYLYKKYVRGIKLFVKDY